MWAARGVDVGSLRSAPNGTLADSARTVAVLDDTLRAGSALDPVDGWIDGGEVVELGALLGEGGNATVHVAEQRRMRRAVAVKIPRGGRASERVSGALVKEAWVGAWLAHPNVVPVHAINWREGAPEIVMKRIEGEAWGELLRDSGLHATFGIEEPLAFHLSVLVQVCDAVHYAHTRGVLHLDVKPDNVMVGRHGEVYLVDWGLAVGLEGHRPTWLPSAREVRTVAGTPAYMPPELAAGDGDSIDARTDVYLLGAALHETLTGRPPHDGHTLREVLAQAFFSEEPTFGPEVPPELARICRRALAREPSLRYESVAALRDSLERYLTHRGADRLTQGGLATLAALRDGGLSDDPRQVERSFNEVGFSIREAMEIWPASPDAARARRELLALRAEHAIAVGDLEVAATCLRELDESDVRIADMLRQALAEKALEGDRVAALARLGRELDLGVGRAARVWAVSLLALGWGVGNVACGMIGRFDLHAFGYADMLWSGACIGVAILGVALGWRRRFFGTRVDRRFTGLLILVWALIQLFWLLAMRVDLPFEAAWALSPFFYFFYLVLVAVAVEPVFGWSAAVWLLTGLASVAAPRAGFEVVGVGGMLSGLPVVWVWRRRLSARGAP